MNLIQRFLTRKKVFKDNIEDWDLCFNLFQDVKYYVPYHKPIFECNELPLVQKPMLYIYGMRPYVVEYEIACYRIKRKYDKQVSKILNQKKD